MRDLKQKVAGRLQIKKADATLINRVKTNRYLKKVAGCSYFLPICVGKTSILLILYIGFWGLPATSQPFDVKIIIKQRFKQGAPRCNLFIAILFEAYRLILTDFCYDGND